MTLGQRWGVSSAGGTALARPAGSFGRPACGRRALAGVVDEGGGEVPVGVCLGELTRVGEHDRDGGVADL